MMLDAAGPGAAADASAVDSSDVAFPREHPTTPTKSAHATIELRIDTPSA
jgi:hypothetical protein